MQKNILRNINFLIYLALMLVAVTLQSTIFKYFPLNFFQPDVLLVLTVYFGFKRENVEGGLFVIIASLLLEAHSGAGRYFFLTAYTYCFVIAKVISKVLVVPNRVTVIVITVALSVFWKLLMLFLLSLAGRGANGFMHFLIYLFPSTLTQAVTAAFCLHWFNVIDMRTYKDEHSEDEYDINRGF
jgi:rod shape-determining protein MreD